MGSASVPSPLPHPVGALWDCQVVLAWGILPQFSAPLKAYCWFTRSRPVWQIENPKTWYIVYTIYKKKMYVYRILYRYTNMYISNTLYVYCVNTYIYIHTTYICIYIYIYITYRIHMKRIYIHIYIYIYIYYNYIDHMIWYHTISYYT